MCAQIYSTDRVYTFRKVWRTADGSSELEGNARGLSSASPGFNARVQEHPGNAAEVEPPITNEKKRQQG